MLTDRARELSQQAQLAEGREANYLARKAYDELFANCQPTELEFIEFASRLVLAPRDVWQLVLNIPQWDYNQKQLEADNKYHTTVSRVKSDAK